MVDNKKQIAAAASGTGFNFGWTHLLQRNQQVLREKISLNMIFVDFPTVQNAPDATRWCEPGGHWGVTKLSWSAKKRTAKFESSRFHTKVSLWGFWSYFFSQFFFPCCLNAISLSSHVVVRGLLCYDRCCKQLAEPQNIQQPSRP